MSATRPDASDASHDVSVDQLGDVAVVTLRRPPHNLLTEPVLRAGKPRGCGSPICS